MDKEAPHLAKDKFYRKNPHFSTMFNLTYSYKGGSDVLFRYASVVPRSGGGEVVRPQQSDGNWLPFDSASVPPDILGLNRTEKTKGILWMVSHCETANRREKVVARLRRRLKTLTIDVLGRCGHDVLPSKAGASTLGQGP